MGKPKSLNNCHTAADFDRLIAASGVAYNERQNGSSHRVYKFPESGVSVPIPQHRGDIPTGTRRSIIKSLALAGLAVVLPFILCNVSSLLGMVPGFN